MANDTEMITTKTVVDLDEKTTPVDMDLFVIGNAGTATLKKLKWSSMLAAIKTKIAEWTFQTLNTSDKTIPGALNELNNKMNVSTYVISGEFIDANAYKASGIKFLRCASFPKKNMSANTVHYFNAVPEDFRPSIRIVQTVIIGVGTEARLELNTDGMASITPATDISTSKGVNFLLTYI